MRGELEEGGEGALSALYSFLSEGANANGGSGTRGNMLNVCAFRQTRGSATAGKWFVRPDFVGRRSASPAVCQTCADSGLTTLLGSRAPTAAGLRDHACYALDSAMHREAAVDRFVRKDIFVVCPWMVDLRRATSA